MKTLPIESILATAETQIRAELRPDLITEYAELYRNKNGLPPIDVFTVRPGGPYLLADGFHRVAAAKEAKLPKIEVEIHTGDKKTAIKFALKVNSCHGARMSNADKRHAVEMALKEFANLSDPVIAEMCGVDRSFVLKIRSSPLDNQDVFVTPSTSATISESKERPENGTVEMRVGADGKKYPAKVKNTPQKPDVPCDTKPEIRHDKTGYPIPPELVAEWDRASDQANGWIRAFDAVHRQVMEAHGQDFAVANINKSTIESLHSNYRENLKQAVPYAVCGTCQGKLPERCKSCNPCATEKGKGKGLGWVNKHFWENCTPVEIQKMREKTYGTKSSARLSA